MIYKDIMSDGDRGNFLFAKAANVALNEMNNVNIMNTCATSRGTHQLGDSKYWDKCNNDFIKWWNHLTLITTSDSVKENERINNNMLAAQQSNSNYQKRRTWKWK